MKAKKTSSKNKATKAGRKKSKKKAGARKKTPTKASRKKSKKKTVRRNTRPSRKSPKKSGAGTVAPGENGQLPFEMGATQTDLTYPAATIAEMLLITDRRLRQLAAEDIIPKQTRGRYPLAGCVQGYVKYLQQLRLSTDERSQEATRLTSVRADTYEIELQIKRQQLYHRDVIDQALFKACTNLTAMLDGTASRIASQLGGGAALRKRLVNEFHEIRTQFAAGLREFSQHLRDDGWNNRPATRHRARNVGQKKSTPTRKRRARSV